MDIFVALWPQKVGFNHRPHHLVSHLQLKTSSFDIIFTSTFDKMGIGREKLEPVDAYLRGFSRERVLPLGSIKLMLTLGDPPCQVTTTVRFLIVDAPSSYNILLNIPPPPPSCHKGYPFRLSYGYQIPYYEWGRNGSRRSTRSHGLLLGIIETKRNWQHLHGQARHER